MQKLARAGIKHPSELKDYIINKTLNPRLINAGGSGFHRTTQQGFLDLVNVCFQSLFVNREHHDCVPMRSRSCSLSGTLISPPKS